MTVEIQLTRGYVATVDNVDADLAAFKWCVNISSSRTPKAYGVRRIADKHMFMHRAIAERMLCHPLTSNDEIDHINGNTLDCRRKNLRLATRRENSRNIPRPITNTSGFKGVVKATNGDKWQAQIRVDGKLKYLGLFITPEEAHAAYCEAGRKYFGEFFNPGDKS